AASTATFARLSAEILLIALGITDLVPESGSLLEQLMVQQGAAEVEDRASAQFAPAHAGALHALLNEMLAADSTAPEPTGRPLIAVGRVAHPLSIGAEIAAFCFERLGSLVASSSTAR